MEWEAESHWTDIVGRLMATFASPWIAMLAWGAFIHMTGFPLPFIGYWAMFMLCIVGGAIFGIVPTRRWVIKQRK